MPEPADTTRILLDLSAGDPAAAERLMAVVYDELRALARRHLRGERAGHTLQPTALVHEAYVRLVDGERCDWTNRAHFFAVASRAIRQVLVDHARRRGAAKRGGGEQRVALEEEPPAIAPGVEILALDEALQRLHALDERQARVVELRFFGGLSVDETAEVLDVSPRTVKGDWQVARAWLRSRLEE